MSDDRLPVSRETLLTEILTFDITRFPSMEAKAVEWANRIAGPRGGKPSLPDPVCVLEMCEDIAAAGLVDAERLLGSRVCP
jgi:hypothetical protein